MSTGFWRGDCGGVWSLDGYMLQSMQPARQRLARSLDLQNSPLLYASIRCSTLLPRISQLLSRPGFFDEQEKWSDRYASGNIYGPACKGRMSSMERRPSGGVRTVAFGISPGCPRPSVKPLIAGRCTDTLTSWRTRFIPLELRWTAPVGHEGAQVARVYSTDSQSLLRRWWFGRRIQASGIYAGPGS